MSFNFPTLFWDPLLRAAALGKLGKYHEAGTAAGELLQLVPDLREARRAMINIYVKADGLADEVLAGLRKAGLKELA